MSGDVRALARGLSIVGMLTDRGCMSLAELQQAVDLPKPTVLRMMRTLESCGWVYRRQGDGRYQLKADLNVRGRTPNFFDHLTELVAPHLEELQLRNGWPSAIGIRDGNKMLILETGDQNNNRIGGYRSIGKRADMLWSAMGRAYMAFCAPEEQDEILFSLKRSRHPRSRLAWSESWLQQLVVETRARGYGIKDPRYIPPCDPPLEAIAVPVRLRGYAIAAINIAWPHTAMPECEAIRRYLPVLRDTVRQIEEEVASALIAPPSPAPMRPLRHAAGTSAANSTVRPPL
ncbi:MAG: helix-turn-helix domain-containing protein [Aquisalimonadaceae bacterium]